MGITEATAGSGPIRSQRHGGMHSQQLESESAHGGANWADWAGPSEAFFAEQVATVHADAVVEDVVIDDFP